MKRLLPLLAVVGWLAAAAIITVVAVGADSGGSDKSTRQAEDSSGDAPGAAMCTKDHPDCNDTAFGGGGTTSAGSCAYPPPDGAECVDVCNVTTSVAADCPAGWPTPDEVFCSVNGQFAVCDPGASTCGTLDSDVATDVACPSGPVDSGPSNPPSGGGGTSPGAGAVTTYDITVPFDATVTDDDTKLANEIVFAFDPNASFLLQESFPPTGRATLSSSDLDLCAAIESKLEGVPSVGDVTCAVSANVNPPCCKPDAPVSSTPAAEPGVNPSQPGSAPDSGPTSE